MRRNRPTKRVGARAAYLDEPPDPLAPAPEPAALPLAPAPAAADPLVPAVPAAPVPALPAAEPLAAPPVPDAEAPAGPPEAPWVEPVALLWRAPVILQSAGSVACTLLSQRSPMLFDLAFESDESP